jgi:hypothetical protein
LLCTSILCFLAAKQNTLGGKVEYLACGLMEVKHIHIKPSKFRIPLLNIFNTPSRPQPTPQVGLLY